MANLVKFQRGSSAKNPKDAQGIFFAIDTQELWMGDKIYSCGKAIKNVTFEGGKLVISYINGDANTELEIGANLTESLNALTTRVDTAEGKITTAEGKITANEAAIAKNVEDIAANTTSIGTKVSKLAAPITASETFSAVKYNADGLVTAGSAVAAVALSGNASDVAITAVGVTATTVDAAVAEVAKNLADAKTADKVTIDTKNTTDGYLKSYTIMQGTEQIGVIDIPKDLVVSQGEVITATAEDTGCTVGEKYIKLTIANQQTPLYIAVKDLVDVYTAAAGATEVQVAISDTNEISASIVAVDGSKLVADSVSKAKLDTTVRASLDKADASVAKSDYDTKVAILEQGIQDAKDAAQNAANAAVTEVTADGDGDKITAVATHGDGANSQQVNIKVTVGTKLAAAIEKADSAVQSIKEGAKNGTISVDGTDIYVRGLGSAAYKDEAYFGTATDLTAVKTTADKAAEDIKTINTDLTALGADAVKNVTVNGKEATVANNTATVTITASNIATTGTNNTVQKDIDALNNVLTWIEVDELA